MKKLSHLSIAAKKVYILEILEGPKDEGAELERAIDALMFHGAGVADLRGFSDTGLADEVFSKALDFAGTSRSFRDRAFDYIFRNV